MNKRKSSFMGASMVMANMFGDLDADILDCKPIVKNKIKPAWMKEKRWRKEKKRRGIK